MKRILLLLSLLILSARAAEPLSQLEQAVERAEQSLTKEVPDKAAWLANRDRYRAELKEMLGLDPEPPRGDLKPVITGTVPGEGIVVEKLHFQSIPGLYVTANFYRPAQASGKLPTILYFSGHGPTYAPDGRSCGNKASYQHHGVWFARHGYNCLILDTVQWGEILGEHWGTYKLNRWWWVSRGYTPAGVETWDGIRALDYLATRPEVDMDKIGCTGRSGGGAYTWFLTAVDDRVKVAAPTAGITTLRDHVIDGVIKGHCDCMYFVNYYGWDFDKLAALSAPRPLLISNTDKDDIFPLGGVMQIHRSTRRIYEFLDAEKNLGVQIAEGPHKDMQPLNIGAFHWFERFLKGKDLMDVIKEPAVKAFEMEQLRVFDELPKDEINTRIDETFVPAAAPPVPQTKEEWATMRDGWMKVLKEQFPSKAPASESDPALLSMEQIGEQVFTPVKWAEEIPRINRADGARIILSLNGEAQARTPTATAEDNGNSLHISFYPALAQSLRGDAPPHEERGYALSSLSLDQFRCQETIRYIQRLMKSRALLSVHAGEKDAGIALYAALVAGGRTRLHLETPVTTHAQGPHFPGILRHLDMQQAVAMAAYRNEVHITGRPEDWSWAVETAERMGFPQRLTITPALEMADVKKIWDAAPHNAFTSLTSYKNEWFITFRESSAHVPGTDGAVRVLVSKDGITWESAALITEAGLDLRDPKFCTAPDGRLMLTIGGSVYDGESKPGAKRRRTAARTRTAFSSDGRTWTTPLPACDDGQWLWRSTLRAAWSPDSGSLIPPVDGPGPVTPPQLYGFAYTVADENKFKLSLWQSADGAQFSRVTNLDPGRNILPNESTLRFTGDGTMLALTRNENSGKRGNAMFGTSQPPYKNWSWTDTGHIIQGPDFLRLADGRMIYGGRDFVDGKPNCTVGILTTSGHAMPMLVLPSGGDCSYPGLAEGPDGQIWVSYYSSHEGKSAIYLARLKLH